MLRVLTLLVDLAKGMVGVDRAIGDIQKDAKVCYSLFQESDQVHRIGSSLVLSEELSLKQTMLRVSTPQSLQLQSFISGGFLCLSSPRILFFK